MSGAPSNLAEALKKADWMRAQIEPTNGRPCLNDEELKASRKTTLSAHATDQGLWVFGYGSLMWNPMFEFTESHLARLENYSRGFCIKVFANVGAPEKPGLMLALDQGGACDGVAFHIAASKLDETLEVLWIREMLAGIYEAKLLPVQLDNGQTVTALVFVANNTHPRYASPPQDEAAQIIATAEGTLGKNRNYLSRLIEKLEEHKIQDEPMFALFENMKKHLQ